MTVLTDLLASAPAIAAHRPWRRVGVGKAGWSATAQALAAGEATLVSLWAEPGHVHMAIRGDGIDGIAIVSLACEDGSFPSVGAVHPAAIRLERTIADLHGLRPEGAKDTRPWLDHGRWRMRHPLAGRDPAEDQPPYPFLPAEGESLHQIPVGPVHAGIIEPGHFRFTANGETVVRLEQRLGYVHKGIDSLMPGKAPAEAARIAGRTSGDSTVAYALAFARAVEAASGVEVPERACWIRALMAEIERLANHLGDIGAICNDAAFALMLAHCGVLREKVLRAADAAFGHRLMMDRIVPGGVAVDPDVEDLLALRRMGAEIRERFPGLVDLYDNTTSLQDRTVSTGHLAPELARRFGAGGYVGRASGQPFDARKQPGYAPYGQLAFETPVREDGDVNARVWIRIREVEQSLMLIEELCKMPAGPVGVELPAGAGEGAALVEGFRGDIFAWVRLGADGGVERCHLRDPSWFQWPLLEAAIEGNIVADFPLCNKSFNCSYSGHDL